MKTFQEIAAFFGAREGKPASNFVFQNRNLFFERWITDKRDPYRAVTASAAVPIIGQEISTTPSELRNDKICE